MQPRTSSARDLGLDTARGVATAAMVFGHTLDALLDWSLRGHPVVATYWRFRGLTAPMFLFVSGWAVATVISRSEATGLAAVRARLGRIGLLLACGFFLRLPTWGWRKLIEGDADVWRHTIGFDALHCVAGSMLVGTLILATFRSVQGRLLALGATAAIAVLLAEPAWALLANGQLALQQWIGGGNAPFTLMPWAGYFLAGASVGVWSRTGVDARRRAMVLAAVGIAFFVAGYPVATLSPPPSNPYLFSLRLGQVLVFAGAFGLLPRRIGETLAPLGRASLGVYLIHVPIVYGWGSVPGLVSSIGPTLSPLSTLSIGLVLLVFSYALNEAWRHMKPWMMMRIRALLPRRAEQQTVLAP